VKILILRSSWGGLGRFKMVASDGVQRSPPVTVTIQVIDANDNTPAFGDVSYNVEVFTDMQPGETVLQVSPASAQPRASPSTERYSFVL